MTIVMGFVKGENSVRLEDGDYRSNDYSQVFAFHSQPQPPRCEISPRGGLRVWTECTESTAERVAGKGRGEAEDAVSSLNLVSNMT